MTIVPKPIKAEYESLRHSINTWCKSPAQFPVLNAVIDSTKLNTLTLPLDEMKNNELNGIKLAALKGIFSSLNPVQKMACKVARASPVSVVQGPPGTGTLNQSLHPYIDLNIQCLKWILLIFTGKTYFIARLVAMLSHYETGKILVAAPTNYATDGLMISLNSMASRAALSIKVFRIYSIKKEADLSTDLTPSGN